MAMGKLAYEFLSKKCVGITEVGLASSSLEMTLVPFISLFLYPMGNRRESWKLPSIVEKPYGC